MVASVHCPYLRNRHVALVYERDEVVLEIIDQAEWPLSRFSAVEVAGIVFYSRAISHFLYHLQIIFYPLFQPFGFEPLADALEIFHLFHQVVLYHAHGPDGFFLGGHEIACRIDRYFRQLLDCRSCYRIDKGQCIDFIAEKLDSHGLVGTAKINIHRVTAHPESASLEIRLSPAEQCVYEMV